MNHYDTIIIGAGQSGLPLALALARAGKKTALIERERFGGTCVNWGCTPTKTMIASARVAHLARRAGDYGVQVSPVTVDLKRVLERKDAVVKEFHDSNLEHLEKQDNLTLIRGEAAFTGERTLEVTGEDAQTLDADIIIINTGQRARLPDVRGLEEVPYLLSKTLLDLDTLPAHLLVLGGGYIGLEFAQTFRRFGARVSVIQEDAQLMPREDADVAEAMKEMLEAEGIEVLLNAQAQEVKQEANCIHLGYSQAGEAGTLKGSHLLVAVGRVSKTDVLNLGAAGIETDEEGNIKVDSGLQTNVLGIYAIGDVKGGPAFTNISYDDYRVLKDILIDGKERSIRGRMVPYAVFTDPELGRVGLTEGEARERGLNIKVAKLPMKSVARAIEMGETQGFMKAIVDADSDLILGCAIFGVQGGEIMSVLQVAMMGGLPYTVLRDSPMAHPTLTESLNNLFKKLE